jgi:hypothetical protein
MAGLRRPFRKRVLRVALARLVNAGRTHHTNVQVIAPAPRLPTSEQKRGGPVTSLCAEWPLSGRLERLLDTDGPRMPRRACSYRPRDVQLGMVHHRHDHGERVQRRVMAHSPSADQCATTPRVYLRQGFPPRRLGSTIVLAAWGGQDREQSRVVLGFLVVLVPVFVVRGRRGLRRAAGRFVGRRRRGRVRRDRCSPCRFVGVVRCPGFINARCGAVAGF